ncbi:unnamed protein product [Mesocestoides corti]|uniref:Small-subunit processome Utp12 domain-containing protein n=1 Tax=Mesocestoides corti TaxID=53468 RepID=A0A0R3UL73_MESCO|nr:unnamed protein product [Mesocestoides corti]
MPITNTYRRYTPDATFGLVANDSVPIKYIKDTHGKSGKCCVTGTGSSVSVWNLRTSLPNEEASFRAGSHRVTSLDLSSSCVACAAESELHVMDIVSGGGFRLKGHRGAITSVKLLQHRNMLISGGRDTFIKFWCLKTQHCFLTLTGHPGPVWDFALSVDQKTLISGSSDASLRLWKIKYNNRATDRSESDFLSKPDVELRAKDNLAQALPLTDYSSLLEIDFRGTIPRKSIRRVFSLTFDPSGRYLVSQTLDKTLEIYVVLSEAERQSRLRKKQKKARKTGNSDPSSVELKAEDEVRCIFRISLPTKLSSCDLRLSHFNVRNPQNSAANSEGQLRITILHVPSSIGVSFVTLKLLCSYRNNLVEEFSLKVPPTLPTRPIFLSGGRVAKMHERGNERAVESDSELRLSSRISNPGHRSYPLGCQITEDGSGVFTLARSEGKLWNRENLSCLATIDWSSVELKSTKSSLVDESDADEEEGKSRGTADWKRDPLKALKASAFVLAPGNRHVVIGFESGVICLFDLLLKRSIQTVDDAHAGAVRSLILTGDRKGVISGTANSKVGFWNFDLELVPRSAPRLCLKAVRQPESVTDQVTALAATPDNRLIAVAMVNLHVDVYFADSFKRVHSLYGMSAPVTCMDVSDDSRLLITGSGDKTVRLWELQFGNCLRRFVEHTDPITAVKFMRSSTLAFSADLGGVIREWDVKKLQEVCTLKGHEGGVTGLSTLPTRPGLGKQMKDNRSRSQPKRGRREADNADDEDADDDDFEADVCGGVVVSTGRDFSCRVWLESEELLVLEEEAELAREAAEDELELGRSEAVVPGAVAPDAGETGPLGRPTVTTRNAADSLMEAIDIYSSQTQSQESEPPHPLMVAYGTANDPDRFLFTVFSALRLPGSAGMAGMEHALGSLHSDHVKRLLPRLAAWLERGWDVELCGRAIRYLCTLHAGLVTTDANLASTLAAAQAARQSYLSRTRKMLGMNLAALSFLQQKIEEEDQVSLFSEATDQRAKRAKKIKERLAQRVAIATG